MVVLVYRMASAVRIVAIPSHPARIVMHNFQTMKSNDYYRNDLRGNISLPFVSLVFENFKLTDFA